MNARPEPDFRYFSSAIAISSCANANRRQEPKDETWPHVVNAPHYDLQVVVANRPWTPRMAVLESIPTLTDKRIMPRKAGLPAVAWRFRAVRLR